MLSTSQDVVLLCKSEDKSLSPTFIRLHFHFSDAALCKAKLELMYFDCIVYYWNDFIFPKLCVFTNCCCNKPFLKGNILRKMQLKYIRNTTKTQFSTFFTTNYALCLPKILSKENDGVILHPAPKKKKTPIFVLSP